MPRDYKNSLTRAGRNGGSGKTVLTGVVIGLLLGIVAALAIALFLNRSPSPFMNRMEQPALKKPAEATLKPFESQPPPAFRGSAKADAKPRFDFYEILPADKEPARPGGNNVAREKSPVAEPPGAATDKGPVAIAAPTPGGAAKVTSGVAWYLQAGAFRKAAEADNLKARLALMGLQASVSPAQIANVGTMHRVRVGPYQSADELKVVKSQLAKNGIVASVVKMSAAKKP